MSPMRMSQFWYQGWLNITQLVTHSDGLMTDEIQLSCNNSEKKQLLAVPAITQCLFIHQQNSYYLKYIIWNGKTIRSLWNCTPPAHELHTAQHSPSWETTGSSSSQKIPHFHGTWTFTATFIKSVTLYVTWARLIQSMLPHPISLRTHFNIILPSTSR